MKLYAVTKGFYSDYHIITLTDDKALAEKLAKKFSDQWDTADVEEFENAEIMLKPAYTVYFDENGNVTDCACYNDNEYKYEDSIYYNRSTQVCDVSVVADTMEQAVKSASEKRAKYLARYFGL